MNDIIGHGGGKGGGSSHTHYEATDSLHSTAYARVMDLVSEGEILGLANGVQSVFLNQTPVQNADGTSNFKGVTIDFRSGTQAQDYIPGFPDVESEVSVNTELKSGSPWVHAINNTALSAIRITLGVPALSKADTSNGDILGYQVAYQVELATDGGAYAVVLSNAFNGKTTSLYQRTARIDLPHATSGWQVRVTRLTPNANTVGISDTTTIVSYTEVIDAKLRYPMSALVGVQVDATQFQSVPTRAYDLFGRIIQVPSNYDSVARTYSGTWDGTFKPAWSSNPAWVFRDLILNDRYGLGDRITASQVDKWALYKIAQYCDQLVPDGKGGQEPRFTCNLYLQSQKQAYAVLQDIASIFRGISYWGAGTIMASADMPSDPVYIYTAANVIGGKFTRTGSKASTRYTVALVTWNDPADFYAQKTEYVEDPEGIKRYGIKTVQLTGFGCTSQGQAHRVGLWALATSRLETEGISFDVGMDGAMALPGQVVRVADPSRMGRRVGGRIRAVNGRALTLDKAPAVSVGDKLTAILPAGATETHTVASVAGDTVTVDADWSTPPRAQAVWSIDSSELSAPLFRILSVAPKDSSTFTITAVQHEPGKYDYVEKGIAITAHSQTSLDVTTQAPPASVTLVGYTVSLNDVQKLALQVSCAPVPGAVAYEGAYRRGNDNWVAIPRQASPTMDVRDILAGTYVAKMSAVNSIGITSIETMSVAVAIDKDGGSKNADILLQSDTPYFHTDQDGQTDPSVITITASLLALAGAVTWSCVGGKLTNTTATTAQLAFTGMTAASATVTASLTMFGRTYTKSLKVGKVQDGAAGADGLKTAIARLFQWAPTAPAKPIGTSTFTWPGTNSGYTGNDGWANPAPANPGTPGWRLFGAAVSLSAASAATSTPVSYANATIEDGPQNGGKGVDGIKSKPVTVYQWAASIPTGPAGSATLNWSDGTFGAAPSGWTLTPGTTAPAGMTQWAAVVQVSDTATAATTAFNWSTASITAAGYAGTNGANAAYVVISSTGQVFSRATSAAAFAPTTLTLTATAYGPSATFQWQFLNGSTWTNVASNGTAGSYTVASGDFTDSRTYRVQATINGTVYTDQMTVVQVTGGRDGQNGISAVTGFLTNESAALPATNAGVVSDFSGAAGTFKVYDGVTDKTGAAAAYSVSWQTGCTVSITSAGAYSVSAMTADSATAVLQAVYGGVTIQKTLSLAKAKAGAPGSSVTGPQGASYVIAFCVTTTPTASGAPAPTNGKTSVPADNSSGLSGTWSSTVPTVPAGSYLFQSGGLYDPSTNVVTWEVPYWSYAKFASLSAITANMGAITAGNIDLGTGAASWHVDAGGNQWAGASSYAAAPFRVSNAGIMSAQGATLKSVTVLADDGSALFKTSQPLSQQVAGNPNLIPRISSWPAGSRYNAGVYVNTNGHPAINGELISIGAQQSGVYMGYESDSIGIAANVYYTVSFDAHCYNGSRDICVDLYGTNVDSVGLIRTLTGTPTRYSFTEIMTVAQAPQARLRVFGTAGSGTAEIYNIKVELGIKMTPWCDNVITSQNVSTYIQAAAIGYAQISYINANQVSAQALSAITANLGTVYAGGGGVCVGDYTGYAWPGQNGDGSWKQGAYFGAGGLLVGNPGAGKYFQLTSDGNIYAPNFSIVNGNATFGGTLTAARVVTTDNMQDNSISSIDSFSNVGSGGVQFAVPRDNTKVTVSATMSGYTSAGQTVGFFVDWYYSNTWVQVQDCTNVTGSSGNVPVSYTFNVEHAGTYRLRAAPSGSALGNATVLKLFK
ncbi:phage tail protein [Massilia sp. 9096]|uniref:TipJ family phage tail tip protein n=1 Tax=Massilia sp. 9096 TaxID=1500894 RepID=UPI00069033C1|nr:phage tail protein [Massilia sp. 9096]